MHHCLNIGVDVGGTKIQAALTNPAGKIFKRYRLPTEAQRGAKTVLENIGKAIAAVWDADVHAIGVGIAGLVDVRHGIFLGGPNFPKSCRRLKIAAILKQEFRVPVVMDNDARCFTLGEALYGAARGKAHVVGLTVGTGIGGGLVLNGFLYRGRDNAAGEIGHLLLEGCCREAKCGCGRFGHFEALAAGPAISRAFQAKTGKKLLALEIAALAARGNAQAQRVIADAAKWLGLGLANLAHAYNPDVIVIGGGVSRAKALWPGLKRSFKANVIYPQLRTTLIVPAKLGDDANVLGAAALVA